MDMFFVLLVTVLIWLLGFQVYQLKHIKQQVRRFKCYLHQLFETFVLNMRFTVKKPSNNLDQWFGNPWSTELTESLGLRKHSGSAPRKI